MLLGFLIPALVGSQCVLMYVCGFMNCPTAFQVREEEIRGENGIISSSTVVTLSFSHTICRVIGRWSKSKRIHIVHKKEILSLLYTEDERERQQYGDKREQVCFLFIHSENDYTAPRPPMENEYC